MYCGLLMLLNRLYKFNSEMFSFLTLIKVKVKVNIEVKMRSVWEGEVINTRHPVSYY